MLPDALVEQLKQLGDPTRLRLLAALSQGELTVGEMTRVTGLSQPRVSRHLRLMTEAGLLRRTPDQNQVYYRLPADSVAASLRHSVLRVLDQTHEPFASDTKRLQLILQGRRRQADDLLDALGIRPLPRETGQAVTHLVKNELKGWADQPRLAVDLGTGTGRMLPILATGVERVIGIDISRDMRLVARSVALAGGLANCSVQAADIYALPFEADSVDFIVMDRVAGVLERPLDALKQVRRVMGRQGLLLVFEFGDENMAAQLKNWFEQADFGQYDVDRLEDTEIWVGRARIPTSKSRAA